MNLSMIYNHNTNIKLYSSVHVEMKFYFIHKKMNIFHNILNIVLKS